MRVGVDARALALTRAGIAAYIRGVSLALAQAGNEVCLFTPARVLLGKVDHPLVRIRVLRFPQRRGFLEAIWQDRILPAMLVVDKIDVFLGPRFWIPSGVRIPKCVTIHDLAFKKVTGLMADKSIKKYDSMIAQSAGRADAILCVSKTTRKDVCELYGVDEKKVFVTYNGYDRFYCRIDENESRDIIRKRLGIQRPYLLFTGTIEPRKNLARLIDAFVVGGFHNDFRLVLAGGWGWLSDDVQERVAGAPPGSVIVTGYVDKECLRALYNACSAFVFPSLYEGFGIPVLEAMACGAPVACADNSALAELFSDSAVLFDERSVSDMARGIREALDRGRELAAAGCEKAQHFGWDRCAAETVSVMERLAA